MEALSQAQLDAVSALSAMSQERISELMLAAQLNAKRGFERRIAEAGSCYSPKFLERVARDFDIASAKMTIMQQILSFAALRYREIKSEQGQQTTPRRIGKEMAIVEKVARQLHSAMANLSSEGAECLWAGQREVEMLALINSATTSPYGHTIIRVDRGDTFEFRYLRLPQLKESVEVIANLAANARKSLRPAVGGRPTDEALRLWVANMENLWVKVLGRKFTYDHYRGEGFTPAFRFCRALLHPLDPHVSGTRLGTMMRRAIRLSGRGKRSPRKRHTR